MATTKKLTPVKRASAKSAEAPAAPESSSPLFTQTEVLEELKKQTEYLHRMDWKLWMIMNIVRNNGEENG